MVITIVETRVRVDWFVANTRWLWCRQRHTGYIVGWLRLVHVTASSDVLWWLLVDSCKAAGSLALAGSTVHKRLISIDTITYAVRLCGLGKRWSLLGNECASQIVLTQGSPFYLFVRSSHLDQVYNDALEQHLNTTQHTYNRMRVFQLMCIH